MALNTDELLVNRDGTTYSTTIDKMADLKDTDLLLVNRTIDGTPGTYTMTGKDLKDSTGGGGEVAPFVDSVVLTQDQTNADRFTNNSFTTTINYDFQPNPIPTIEMTAEVTGNLGFNAATSPITANGYSGTADGTSVTLTLETDANLGTAFEVGDVVIANATYTPTTSNIAKVEGSAQGWEALNQNSLFQGFQTHLIWHNGIGKWFLFQGANTQYWYSDDAITWYSGTINAGSNLSINAHYKNSSRLAFAPNSQPGSVLVWTLNGTDWNQTSGLPTGFRSRGYVDTGSYCYFVNGASGSHEMFRTSTFDTGDLDRIVLPTIPESPTYYYDIDRNASTGVTIACVYGPGKRYARATGGPNGSWTLNQLPGTITNDSGFNCVVYAPAINTWVMLSQSSPDPSVYSTDDGVTWQECATDIRGQGYGSCVWNDEINKFVMVGGLNSMPEDSTKLLYSDDGITWYVDPVNPENLSFNNYAFNSNFSLGRNNFNLDNQGFYKSVSGFSAGIALTFDDDQDLKLFQAGDKLNNSQQIKSWSGNSWSDTNGITIENGVDLTEGGMVWMKQSTGSNSHWIYDTIRGTNVFFNSANNAGNNNSTTGLTSFNSNGYTVGVDGSANASNMNGFAFKKQKGFFDVVTWDGNDQNARSIPHDLGEVPGLVLIRTTQSGPDWVASFLVKRDPDLGGADIYRWYRLNQDTGADALVNYENGYAQNFTDTEFNVYGDSATDVAVNDSGKTYIGYVFAGYDKSNEYVNCGEYSGISADKKISTPFAPAWVMIKCGTVTADWYIFYKGNPSGQAMRANSDAVKNFGNSTGVEMESDGFTIKSTDTDVNQSNLIYNYIAIAEDATINIDATVESVDVSKKQMIPSGGTWSVDTTVSTKAAKQGKGTISNISGSDVTISPFTDNCFKEGQYLNNEDPKPILVTPTTDTISTVDSSTELTLSGPKDLSDFDQGDAVYMVDSNGDVKTVTLETSAVNSVGIPPGGQTYTWTESGFNETLVYSEDGRKVTCTSEDSPRNAIGLQNLGVCGTTTGKVKIEFEEITNQAFVGFARQTFQPQSSYPGADTNAIGFRFSVAQNTLYAYYSGTVQSTLPLDSLDHKWEIEFDFDQTDARLYQDGVPIMEVNPVQWSIDASAVFACFGTSQGDAGESATFKNPGIALGFEDATNLSSFTDGTEVSLRSKTFATKTYDGNGSNKFVETGVNNAGGASMVWVKSRDAGQPMLSFDTLRTQPPQNLSVNSDYAEGNAGTAGDFVGWQSNGATIRYATGFINRTGEKEVMWNWKAKPGFCDIVKYSGSSNPGLVVPHNLKAEPGFIIMKNYTASGNEWTCWHHKLGTFNPIMLNSTNPPASFQCLEFVPDENNFHPSPNTYTSAGGDEYVAMLFPKFTENVIKTDKYAGDSNTTKFIECGFQPAWVMVKAVTAGSSSDWRIYDTSRRTNSGISNRLDLYLCTNSAKTEQNDSYITVQGNGFVVNSADGWNTSGDEYIYIAIAENLTSDDVVGTVVGDATIDPPSMVVTGGAWSNGDTAKSIKSGTGVVDSVDASTNKMTLSTSNGQWVAGFSVQTAQKNKVTQTGYLEFNSQGTVTGFGQFPYPAVTMDSAKPVLTFPSQFGTNTAPDAEFPNPTSLLTRITAKNTFNDGTVNTSSGVSNALFPQSTINRQFPAAGDIEYNAQELAQFIANVQTYSGREAAANTDPTNVADRFTSELSDINQAITEL